MKFYVILKCFCNNLVLLNNVLHHSGNKDSHESRTSSTSDIKILGRLSLIKHDIKCLVLLHNIFKMSHYSIFTSVRHMLS